MITDSELLKLVKYKIGIYDLSKSLPEGGLEKVKDLTIRNHSLSGEPLDIDLTQIGELTNLEDLDVVRFALERREADTIESLRHLKGLTIRDSMICDTIDVKGLERLTVEASNIDPEAMLPDAEYISLIELDDIDLSKIDREDSKLRSLLIRGGNIYNFEVLKRLPNLSSVIIEGAEADKSILNELAEKGMYVRHYEDKSRIDLGKTI